MKSVVSLPRLRGIPLAVGIGIALVVVGIILHFVPIRQERGFIANEMKHESSAVTCEAAIGHKSYRLILNEMSKYNQTKDKFGKNVADGPCPPGVDTTISLYIF
jgi:hypothetical protein